MQKKIKHGKGFKWVPFLGLTWNIQGHTFDPLTGRETHVWGHNPKRDKIYMVPMSSINSPQKLADEFAKQGVAVMDAKILQSYVHEYKDSSREAIMSRMGWVDKNRTQFLMPHGLLQMEGRTLTTSKPLIDPGIQMVMDKRDSKGYMGHEDDWLDVISSYHSPNMFPLQATILASIGAPLFELLGIQNSSVLSLISARSGTGKSTVLQVADSVWGKPNDPSTLTKRDTDNGRYGTLSAYGNLPVTLDEHTTMNATQAQDFIFAVAEGTDKNAMNQDRTLQELRTWKTPVLTTGNVSLKDKLRGSMATDSDAAMKRVCDLLVTHKPDTKDHKKFSDMLDTISNRQYGSMGSHFAGTMMLSRPFLKKTYDEYYAHFLPLADERFTTRLFSVIMTVADTLAMQNKDTFFSAPDMCEYLTNEMVSQAKSNSQRLEIEQFIPSDLLGEFSLHVVPRSVVTANLNYQSVNDAIPRLPDNLLLWSDDDGYYYCTKALIAKYLRDNRLQMTVAAVLERWLRSGNIETFTSPKGSQYDSNMRVSTYIGYNDGNDKIWKHKQMRVIKFRPIQ